MERVPSIQDIHITLLCGILDGSDLLVADDFASIVIRDMAEAAFSDEKACFWCDGVDVLFELIQGHLIL